MVIRARSRSVYALPSTQVNAAQPAILTGASATALHPPCIQRLLLYTSGSPLWPAPGGRRRDTRPRSKGGKLVQPVCAFANVWPRLPPGPDRVENSVGKAHFARDSITNTRRRSHGSEVHAAELAPPVIRPRHRVRRCGVRRFGFAGTATVRAPLRRSEPKRSRSTTHGCDEQTKLERRKERIE